MDTLEALAKLSPSDLREARQRIAYLLGESAGAGGTKVAPKASPDEELLYKHIGNALEGVGLPPLPSFRPWRAKSTAAKSYVVMAEGLFAYIHRYLKPRGPVELVRAVEFCVSFVVRRRNARSTIVGLMEVIYDLGRISALLNTAFPGYRESNLLPMLVKQQVQREQD